MSALHRHHEPCNEVGADWSGRDLILDSHT